MAEFTNESVDSDLARRTANYKANIWNYDHLQSLANEYDELKCEREIEALKVEASRMLSLVDNKLELIDEMNKLGISHYFEKEIIDVVEEIATSKNITITNDPYTIALYFRILRQYGYNVSSDVFCRMMSNEEYIHLDTKTITEIREASYLGTEDECLLDEAKLKALMIRYNEHEKNYLSNCPLHWSVGWFNVKKHILVANNKSSILLPLAKLSFKMVQVQHQNNFRDVLSWWKNLGLSEVLTFARDRLAESYLWAVGIAYEPQYGSLRKWLTKAITFILIIDDVYDIYGSEEELEQFTYAVERWDPKEIEKLPKAIKTCFMSLYNTINDMDVEIQEEKNWDSVLPHLKKVWLDFCKALHVESKWYHSHRTPSFKEYLNNGWTSSSGPVLSLLTLLGVGKDMVEILDVLNNSQEIIYHSSMIIRLCNDQATSKAEMERGDAASSIHCYMIEEKVSEEEARSHIKNTITCSWNKINDLFLKSPQWQQPLIKYIVNMARLANFTYQNGDGFGDQDGEIRDQVLSCLIEPLPLT